jgi:hypothetical protein
VEISVNMADYSGKMKTGLLQKAFTCPLSRRERVRVRAFHRENVMHSSPPAHLPKGEGTNLQKSSEKKDV